ncbi:MAG: His/Gly/Thr/Pro-type tRNA ligase C-terminal domain-containing protein, partial [Candidatus Bathyarchaeia archaeon]
FNPCLQVLEKIGLTKDAYEAALRFTKDFYEENKDFVESLAKAFGKPLLVEMWEKPFFYFRLKWDFNYVDNQNKAAAHSRDQIDVENARRYEITYVDEKGEKHHPLILHCSPSGAIERCVYALLEKAYKEQQSGKPPMLPLWLSPTQVRIIPMSDKYLENAEKLAEIFESHCIRVDIDDRTLTLQKRVREAEMEWIPYIIVVGQREAESGVLAVRDRKMGEIRKMKVEELLNEIENLVRGKPFKPLPLPKYISRRPQFYG